MTHRSVLTTQSKLSVQAPAMGSGVPGQSDIPVAWPAERIPALCPVSGVGRLNGSLLSCLRKDVALCHTASRARNGGTFSAALEIVEYPFYNEGLGRRHISCAPSWMQVGDGSRLAYLCAQTRAENAPLPSTLLRSAFLPSDHIHSPSLTPEERFLLSECAKVEIRGSISAPDIQAKGTPFYQATAFVLHSPTPEERFSAKRMRPWSRAKNERRRFAPSLRVRGSHSSCPEVWQAREPSSSSAA